MSSKAVAQPAVPTLYRFTVDGQTITLTEPEYAAERTRVAKRLGLGFDAVAEQAAWGLREHREFMEETHGWAGIVSDILGDTVPPHEAIWSWPRSALERGRKALAEGRIDVAGRMLKIAQESLRDAQREWRTYIEQTSEGAGTAITALEFTRDVSFAIAIGTAAVVAAPVVAGAAAAGAGGLGLTGAAATTATMVGTGATVTAGGAAVGAGLRGGTSIAGQALTGDEVNWTQVGKEFKEGAKRGAVDAGSAVVGLGAAKALGVGARGLTASQQVIRGAGAGTVAGATGGGAGAALEGKSAGEVLDATLQGGAAGAIGGGLGAAGNKLLGSKSAATRVVTEVTAGAGGGAAGAALAGGSAEDIRAGALSGAVGGIAGGSKKPTSGRPKSTKLELDTRPWQKRKQTPPVHAERDLGKPLKRSGLETDAAAQPERPVAHAERDLGPAPEGSLELDKRSWQERGGQAEAPPHAERDLGPAPGGGLELDTRSWQERGRSAEGPPHAERDLGPTPELTPDVDKTPWQQRQQPAPAHNERALDPGQGPAPRLYRGKKPAGKIPGVKKRKQEFGEPSQEKAGTFARKGMHFNELTAAEIVMGLRVDYDPQAGRPRKVTYRVDAAASGRQSESKRGFAKDPGTEGAQPTNRGYKKSRLDRGHLAQREAAKGDRSVERAADLMTGVVPMKPKLNRGRESPWRAAEERTMRLAKEHGSVTVEVEPIYDAKPKRLRDGTPIPTEFRRKVVAPDGTVLEDLTFKNK